VIRKEPRIEVQSIPTAVVIIPTSQQNGYCVNNLLSIFVYFWLSFAHSNLYNVIDMFNRSSNYIVDMILVVFSVDQTNKIRQLQYVGVDELSHLKDKDNELIGVLMVKEHITFFEAYQLWRSKKKGLGKYIKQGEE
jgi:hypothetical protein